MERVKRDWGSGKSWLGPVRVQRFENDPSFLALTTFHIHLTPLPSALIYEQYCSQ